MREDESEEELEESTVFCKPSAGLEWPVLDCEGDTVGMEMLGGLNSGGVGRPG